MVRLLLVPLAVAVLVLAACGESSSDKAKSTICDARADISKQVDSLKGVTLSAQAPDQVKQSLQAIGKDLEKIKDARGDLDGELRDQVRSATETFANEVKGVAADVGSGLSVANAKSRLRAAAQQLAASYRTTLATISCD